MKRTIVLGLIALLAISILSAEASTVEELYTELIITGATHEVAVDVINTAEIDDEGNIICAPLNGWYEGKAGWYLIRNGRCIQVIGK